MKSEKSRLPDMNTIMLAGVFALDLDYTGNQCAECLALDVYNANHNLCKYSVLVFRIKKIYYH